MISVAILGAGIGAEHLAAFRKLKPDFTVRMVVDQDTTRAQALVQDGDSFAIATSVEAALNDPEVDMVDICLPPHLHVPVTLKALAAGKSVICEKPLATGLLDVARVTQAAERAQRAVYPVFQYRWGHPMTQLRHLIETGVAGAPQVASIETHWSRGADYYAVPWRGTWEGEMGGAVLGHAIHNHDLLTHFMGPVAKLSAFTATRVNPIETEDCAAIALQMANGAMATSSITLGAAQNETRLRFVFEHLTATSGTAPYAPGAQPWSFVARNAAKQAELDDALSEVPVQKLGFVGFFEAIASAERGEPSDAVRLSDGAASIELVTAIYHSAQNDETVSLPLRAEHPAYKGWRP